MLKSALTTLLLSALLVAGCSQKDLGRYCFVGVSGGGNSNDFTLQALNTEAPECGERLCLKQSGYKCKPDTPCSPNNPDDLVKLQPMCTQECETNADCEATDDNVNGCGKYVCQRQGEETGFGDHCICVCLDFIRDSSGNPIDEATFNSAQEDYSACEPK